MPRIDLATPGPSILLNLFCHEGSTRCRDKPQRHQGVVVSPKLVILLRSREIKVREITLRSIKQDLQVLIFHLHSHSALTFVSYRDGFPF